MRRDSADVLCRVYRDRVAGFRFQGLGFSAWGLRYILLGRSQVSGVSGLFFKASGSGLHMLFDFRFFGSGDCGQER